MTTATCFCGQRTDSYAMRSNCLINGASNTSVLLCGISQADFNRLVYHSTTASSPFTDAEDRRDLSTSNHFLFVLMHQEQSTARNQKHFMRRFDE